MGLTKNISDTFEIIEKISTHTPIAITNCGHLVLTSKQMTKDNSHIVRPRGRKDYLLVYINDGYCEITVNGKIFKVGKNCLFIYKPDEPQDYYFKGENVDNYFIHFYGTECEKIINSLSFDESHIFTLEHKSEIEYCLKKICYSYVLGGKSAKTVSNGYLLSALGHIDRYGNTPKSNSSSSNNKTEELLSEVISMFRITQRMDKEIIDYANYCNVSERHFCRLFKKATGTSPLKYITLIKFDYAKELLFYSDYTISEISEKVGYDDPNYFSRLFKKQFGVTPREFRKNVLK